MEKKDKYSVEEVEQQTQEELKRNPSNKKYRLKLQNVLDVIRQSKEIINQNETYKKELEEKIGQYNNGIQQINQKETQLKAAEKQLKDYEARLLLNTDRIALETASSIVPKTNRKGRPRPITDIMSDIKEIIPKILDIITPQEEEKEIELSNQEFSEE